MLYKFQVADIERIRNNFSTHPLFCSFSSACKSQLLHTGTICLSSEEVFVRVVLIFDDIKEKQREVNLTNLWVELFNDYKLLNQTATEEDINTTCTIIFAILFIALHNSIPYFYHELAKQIRKQIPYDFRKATQIINSIIEKTDCKTLSDWIDNYMQTDEFLSDELKSYYNLHKDEDTQHRFPYYIAGLSEIIVEDIEKAFHVAAKNGASDLARVIDNYKNHLSICSINKKQWYEEFHKYYGLTITYSAFNKAMRNKGF